MSSLKFMAEHPGFLNQKNVDGNIDEVRIWNVALDEATINDWMHQDLNDNHPNWPDLALYHKYNLGTGSTAEDASGNGHTGDLSQVSNWVTSTAPFKGSYGLYSSTPVAVWQDHPVAESAPLTISNSGLTGISSVLIGNDEASLSQFFNDGPTGYTTALGRVWRATVQGSSIVRRIVIE